MLKNGQAVRVILSAEVIEPLPDKDDEILVRPHHCNNNVYVKAADVVEVIQNPAADAVGTIRRSIDDSLQLFVRSADSARPWISLHNYMTRTHDSLSRTEIVFDGDVLH